MRITLVTSPFFDHASFYADRTPSAQAYVPLGLLSLAANIRRPGYHVSIADLNIAYNEGVWSDAEEFYGSAAAFLVSFTPDVLGFLTAYDSYHHILQICREVKRLRPAIIIVLGGYQATVCADETIRYFSFIDVVVRGEGEDTLYTLLEFFMTGGDLSQVDGITFRRSGDPIRNRERPLIPDLDRLPFPAYDLYPLDKRQFVYLEIGRGCPFYCTYCSTAPFWRRKTRYKSVARVFDEITILRDTYGITHYHFVHDLFTIDRKWVRAFCEATKGANELPRWTCSASFNTVSEGMIEMMASAGCVGIYFGVESGSAEIRERTGKPFDAQFAVSILKKALGVGIAPVTGFIAGLPFETEDDLRATFNTVLSYKQLGVPLVHVFVAIPERGSALYQEYCTSLRRTTHFLDFPVPPSLMKSNFQLMETFPEVFSGLYRFKNEYMKTDCLNGIDEFSPIVNALHIPITIAIQEVRDALLFYSNWIEWIGKRNVDRGKTAEERYYGSTRDMLDYLSQLRQNGTITRPYMDDVLAYEYIKNDFRKNMEQIQDIFAEYTQTVDVNAENTRRVDEIVNAFPLKNRFSTSRIFEWDVTSLYSGSENDQQEPVKRTTSVVFFVRKRETATIGDFFKDVLADVSSIKLDPINMALVEMSNGRTRVGAMSNAVAEVATALGYEGEIIARSIVRRVRALSDIGVISLNVAPVAAIEAA